MSQRLPLVVLVPGAWHKPTCFKQLQHELRTLGLPSATVAHPSVGSSSVPLKTLTDDVASPRHTLENISDNGDEIVLLMHSYGGVVGSAAAKDLSISQRRAQGKSGGILMMIYLAAFALPAGTSLFEAAGGTAPAWWEYRGIRYIAMIPSGLTQLMSFIMTLLKTRKDIGSHNFYPQLQQILSFLQLMSPGKI